MDGDCGASYGACAAVGRFAIIASVRKEIEETVEAIAMTHQFSAPYILEPRNQLERLILDYHQGKIDERIFHKRLVDRTVYVATDDLEEAERTTGFKPVILVRDGREYVAVFSMMDRTETLVREGGGSVQMLVRQILDRVPPGIGIALNPNYEAAVEIPPEKVEALREVVRARVQGSR